ncbi:uncharacterized protein LOC130736702 [Lotus japonicus]|uniref:uncharacterized protein LOC130736702 n=1 Tax=Lotus japonicus TaxID=34305 RepID=UPI00258D6478|nr:uncharacterized protein LOC130736702 [Lotus japonicus]
MHLNGQRFIKDLIRSRKPDIVILVETRCQFAQASQLWSSMGFTPSFISEASGFRGGIWVLTRIGGYLHFRELDTHHQVVSFEMWRDNFAWACSAVYASPVPSEREELWQHLIYLRSTINVPWFIIGDLNEVLHPSKVRGGEFIASRASKFADTVEACGLVDLGMVGGNFTWFQKRNNQLTLSKRLDRALGDVEWRIAFPEAYVEALNRIHLDHCPLLVHCCVTMNGNGERPFRYMGAWADHPDYKNVVEMAWRRVRGDSKNFNQEVFGNIFRRKRRVEGRLR